MKPCLLQWTSETLCAIMNIWNTVSYDEHLKPSVLQLIIWRPWILQRTSDTLCDTMNNNLQQITKNLCTSMNIWNLVSYNTNLKLTNYIKVSLSYTKISITFNVRNLLNFSLSKTVKTNSSLVISPFLSLSISLNASFATSSDLSNSSSPSTNQHSSPPEWWPHHYSHQI